jgi:hypothetical protein
MLGAAAASAVLAAVLATPAAIASPRCDAVPAGQWKTEQALRDKLQGEGLKVQRVKKEHGCWEVKATDARGAKVETYRHPVTLEPVR